MWNIATILSSHKIIIITVIIIIILMLHEFACYSCAGANSLCIVPTLGTAKASTENIILKINSGSRRLN